MCTSTTESTPNHLLYSAFSRRWPSIRPNLQVRRLSRRRRLLLSRGGKEKKGVVGGKIEMEIKNLKLYMENQSIIQENEKLRKKALLLHQENQALIYQLQNKAFSTNKNKNNH